MPKIKIVSVPKYFAGGPYDITTTTTMPSAPELQVEERDFYGCIVGKEQWSQADQMCMPIEGGYNPKADERKNQPIVPVTNSAGQTVGGTGGQGVVPGETEIELKCPDGYVKNKKGQCVPKGRALRTISDITKAGLAAGNVFATMKQNAEQDAAFKKDFRNRMFTGPTSVPGREFLYGNVETNTGVQFPASLTPVNEGMFSNQFYGAKQFGGELIPDNNQKKMKIKILETPGGATPKMKYGGQSGYSLDMGWKRGYTEMNKTSSDHFTNSISEDDSQEQPPVLEAEAKETLYKPGDQTMFTIQGKRHSEGGVPLTQEQVSSEKGDMPSFIFSDTKKLKIKDKDLLKHFGMSYKKGGFTPAAISKRFDLNQYKAIVEDVNSDALAKKTAEFMIQKNERKLSELAAVQEAMKGQQAPQFVEQKMNMAKHGGYIPGYGADISIPDLNSVPLMTFDEGGPTTITTTAAPTEGVVFTPEQYEAFRNKKLTVSERAKKGDIKVPFHQDKQKSGRYGDVSEENVAELKARHPWYFKDKPNWSGTNEKDVADFQQRYNEEYAKKYGFTYFVPKGGQSDRKFNRLDGLLGEYTYNAPALDEDKKPEEQPSGYTIITTTTRPPAGVSVKWICLPNENGKGQVVQTDSGIGYDSPEEAAKNCGRMPVKPPFDYLAPDKLNMLGKAALFPKKIRPFYADMAFNPRQLNLQDWRARTAQIQSTMYNAPSQQLAQYTGSQGLASNLSALAGQAAEKAVSEGIAPVVGWNIEQSNRFAEDEAKRQDTVNAYNNLQQLERYKGYAVGEQNFMNAVRGYIKENSDAFKQAWDNRMNFGDINDTLKHYYKSPTTGRNVFYNPAMRGMMDMYPGASGEADLSLLGDKFSAYYSNYYKQLGKLNLPEEKRQQQATELANNAIQSGRVTSSYNPNDPSKSKRTSYGFDFE